MDFKTFAIKNTLRPFFVIVTCICGAMAILGMLFEPDRPLSYQVLLSPLIFGAATTLPSLVNYSKHELSIREAFVRKLFQFALIELIVLLIVYSTGALTSASLAMSLALSVLLIYVTVNLVMWIDDHKTSAAFNKALIKMQENYKKD